MQLVVARTALGMFNGNVSADHIYRDILSGFY